MGWGVDDLKKALAGSLIENRYVVDWCPKWMQRLGEAVLLEDDPTVEDNIPRIARALAKKESTTYKTYERAIEKLKRSGTLRDFLIATRELRRIRNRESTMGVAVRGSNVSQCVLTINITA
jgi:hypothetical protein